MIQILTILGLLVLSAATSSAQTITMGPIAKTNYCVGDTMIVSYQASGTFQPDNFFTLQSSDPNGSFSTFINLGHEKALSGTFVIRMGNPGNHFRVRVAATNPYFFSSDNGYDIAVINLPSPSIGIQSQRTRRFYWDYRTVGFTGEDFNLFDNTSGQPETSRLWTFDNISGTDTSTDSLLHLSFTTPGDKSATLRVTNANGCSATTTFSYNLASCNPIIPSTAHIVTATEQGEPGVDTEIVWVKAGGNYTTTASSVFATIFAEPGSSLTLEFPTYGIIYLRDGASLATPQNQGIGLTIVMTPNRHLTPGEDEYDTLYCPDLTFDYSQFLGVKSDINNERVNVIQTTDRLIASSSGEAIDIRLFSLIGTELLSQHGAGTLDIDLTPIPAGIYFAVIESGGQREVKKIAVVH